MAATATGTVTYQPYPGPQNQVMVQQLIVSGPAPRTYVILSWISCVFCFPIGLVAVIKAHEADRYLMNGDFDGARRSAQVAKYLAIAALVIAGIIILGVTGWLIFFFGFLLPSIGS
ncbi:hypothetical protein ACHWQZ_G016226 [Mnemiopsis leidyi]